MTSTAPTADDILEGVILAIETDIVPALANPKAHATAAMIQALLQSLRQQLPVVDGYMVEEHNDMLRVLRETAAALGDISSPAADRIRDRADTLGAGPDRPPLPDLDELRAAHRELGQALEADMLDLDELQRAGETRADEALQVIRAHLAPRYLRDVATVAVGAGMLGRG